MNRKPIYIFIAVCFGLSLAAAGVFHFAGGVYASLAGTVFASVYMLLPLLSVIITQLLCGEKPLRGCGIRWKINRWWFVAWIGMLLLTAAAVPVSGLLPGVECTLGTEPIRQLTGQFAQSGLAIGPWGAIGITLLSGLLAGITINALFAFGEEVAWRGFLARELTHLGFWKKSLLIGAVWGIWHAPMILMGHNYPDHPVIGVFMMTAFCMLLSPVFMYLREKSGSVVVAAIAHGTVNAVAGLSLMLLSGYNDLLCGSCGMAGMAVLAVVDVLIGCVLKKKSISITQTTKKTNMNKLNIYYCPNCKNVGIAYGKAQVECCDCKIEPVAIENEGTVPAVTEMDGEYLLEYDCPMTKDNFIAAVIVERYDRVRLIRLFPEQAAEVRVAQVKGAKIYTVFYRQGKVWCEIMK